MDGRGFRIEEDLLGKVEVPSEALYGAQTRRAVENFPLRGERTIGSYPELVAALLAVKTAAASANVRAGLLAPPVGEAIASAAGSILERGLLRPVPDSPPPRRRRHVGEHERQRGAGERRGGAPRRPARRVPARPPERPRQPQPVDERRLPHRLPRRAGEGVGASLGVARPPRLGASGEGSRAGGRPAPRPHLPAGRRPGDVGRALRRLGEPRRTADATVRPTPSTACTPSTSAATVMGDARGRAGGLPRGGRFPRSAEATGDPRYEHAADLYDAAQNPDDMVNVASQLGLLARGLVKIAKDLRLLSSGPEAGLGELRLPPRAARLFGHARQGEPRHPRVRRPARASRSSGGRRPARPRSTTASST